MGSRAAASIACTRTARTPTVSAACSVRNRESCKRLAEPLALLSPIDREAAEHHNAYGMGGEAVADTLWRLGAAYAAGGRSVISHNHPVAAVGNVYSRGVVLDVYPCEAFKPHAQGFIAAFESAQVVVFGKLLNDEFRARGHQRLSATEPRANRRFSPGGTRGLASSALTNAFHALGGKTK